MGVSKTMPTTNDVREPPEALINHSAACRSKPINYRMGVEAKSLNEDGTSSAVEGEDATRLPKEETLDASNRAIIKDSTIPTVTSHGSGVFNIGSIASDSESGAFNSNMVEPMETPGIYQAPSPSHSLASVDVLTP